MTLYVPDDVVVQGSLVVTGTKPSIAKTDHSQVSNAEYFIPWTFWRVYDALATNLPGTSASDDLGLIGGTAGTNHPAIETYDLKNAGATSLYARCQFSLPPEYDTGESVTIRAKAGMVTTVASASATIDFSAYLSDGYGGITGIDLVTTAATTINSLTQADKDFTVTATSLAPGSILDVLMTVAINDSGTGTVVKGRVGYVKMLLDIKG